MSCLSYNSAARVSPKKYFVLQFAGVEEFGPCTLDKCGQSIFILVTTAAIPIATSAATPVGPSCQSRSSGSWFQKPALYPRTVPSQKWWSFAGDVTASSRGILAWASPAPLHRLFPEVDVRAPTRFICTFLPVAFMAAPRRRRTVAIVSPGDNVIRPAWSGPRSWTCSTYSWMICDRFPVSDRAVASWRETSSNSGIVWLPFFQLYEHYTHPARHGRKKWRGSWGRCHHGPLCKQAHRPCYACGGQAGNCTLQIVRTSNRGRTPKLQTAVLSTALYCQRHYSESRTGTHEPRVLPRQPAASSPCSTRAPGMVVVFFDKGPWLRGCTGAWELVMHRDWSSVQGESGPLESWREATPVPPSRTRPRTGSTLSPPRPRNGSPA